MVNPENYSSREKWMVRVLFVDPCMREPSGFTLVNIDGTTLVRFQEGLNAVECIAAVRMILQCFQYITVIIIDTTGLGMTVYENVEQMCNNSHIQVIGVE